MEGWLFFLGFIFVCGIIWGIVKGQEDKERAQERGLTFDERINNMTDFTPTQKVNGVMNMYVFAVDKNHRKVAYLEEDHRNIQKNFVQKKQRNMSTEKIIKEIITSCITMLLVIDGWKIFASICQSAFLQNDIGLKKDVSKRQENTKPFLNSERIVPVLMQLHGEMVG